MAPGFWCRNLSDAFASGWLSAPKGPWLQTGSKPMCYFPPGYSPTLYTRDLDQAQRVRAYWSIYDVILGMPVLLGAVFRSPDRLILPLPRPPSVRLGLNSRREFLPPRHPSVAQQRDIPVSLRGSDALGINTPMCELRSPRKPDVAITWRLRTAATTYSREKLALLSGRRPPTRIQTFASSDYLQK